MKTITIIPAHGRDYSSQTEAHKAFLSGVDFRVADLSYEDNGKYCSIRDLTKYQVKIRFNKLRNFYFYTYGIKARRSQLTHKQFDTSTFP